MESLPIAGPPQTWPPVANRQTSFGSWLGDTGLAPACIASWWNIVHALPVVTGASADQSGGGLGGTCSVHPSITSAITDEVARARTIPECLTRPPAFIKRGDPEGLYETCRRHHISMCGVVPAVIVLETLRLLGVLTKAERVGYATSADVTGDPSRVVGYAGVLFGSP